MTRQLCVLRVHCVKFFLLFVCGGLTLCPNQATKNSKRSSRNCKNNPAQKEGVSVYGLGRFPVTLYYEQWTRLLEAVPELKAFLEEQKAAGKLKLKES
jgi:hypothetical protein